MDKNGDGKGGGKGPGINDLLLWKAFTHDIDPLDGVPDWAELEEEARKQNQTGGTTAKKESVSFMPSQVLFRQTTDPNPQLDRRTEERFRKGKMTIEGRLDLHGLTQSEAHVALTNFIENAYAAGKRCVIVITGKGTPRSTEEEQAQHGSGTRKGILRARVPGWLTSAPLSRLVLKIAPTQPKDGGSGAFYVYLKRNR